MALAKYTEEKIEFYLEGMEVYKNKSIEKTKTESFEERMGWCCTTTQQTKIIYWEVA